MLNLHGVVGLTVNGVIIVSLYLTIIFIIMKLVDKGFYNFIAGYIRRGK